MPVEIVHWNPEVKRLRLAAQLKGTIVHKIARRLPIRAFVRRLPTSNSPINNFGDLLGPMIVEEIVRRFDLERTETSSHHRLLAVGSILQMAQTGDTVWGAGTMKDIETYIGDVTRLDVRAVRGPITRSHLIQLGHNIPEIYGDPALLLGHLWGREHFYDASLQSKYVVIPHYTEFPNYAHMAEVVSPLDPLDMVLKSIASSDLVISSSLHGLIVAESFGIPAVLLAPQGRSLMKYWDYYLGTGRNLPDPVRSVEEALRCPTPSPLNWSPDQLLEAFPDDLWFQPQTKSP